MQDNVKARWLNNELNNDYIQPGDDDPIVRSQLETYKYLHQKIEIAVEVSSH